jgi:hypothetical protein
MKLLQVTNKQGIKAFHQVPELLYRNDPHWVCPLEKDLEMLFHKDTNPFLIDGDCRRWVLYSEQAQVVGRIAAFYSRSHAAKEPQPTGGAGFFECINSQPAASLLLDAARSWLKENGMEAMDAPVNPGPNDNNWGLLIEGFTHPGFGMPYNLPYYHGLLAQYGFKEYYRQYSYHLDIRKPFPERVWRIADRVLHRPGISFRHFRYRESEKFIADVVKVYNEAWAKFKDDFTPLQPESLRNSLQKAKAVIDEKLIWFAYHEDEPIAFFILMPDVNQILRKMNGKLSPWNLIRFLFYLKTKKITRVRAIAAGVIPRFQNTGIESGIFKQLEKVFFSPGHLHYKEIELSWVGDFNPKMRSIYESLGADLAKIHITLRLHFDEGKPVERFMGDQLELAEKFNIRQFHVKTQ